MIDTVDSNSERLGARDEERESQKQVVVLDWQGPKKSLGSFFRTVFNTLPPEVKSQLRQRISKLEPTYHQIITPGEVIHDLGHDGRGFEDFPSTLPLKIDNMPLLEDIDSNITAADLSTQVANRINQFVVDRHANGIEETWDGQNSSLAKQGLAIQMLGEAAEGYSATLTLHKEPSGDYSLLNIAAHVPDVDITPDSNS